MLKIIGGAMAERATDTRLGRETRRSLIFSLVVECFTPFGTSAIRAIPYVRTQQMLRSLDDEVRAHGAGAIQRLYVMFGPDRTLTQSTFSGSAISIGCSTVSPTSLASGALSCNAWCQPSIGRSSGNRRQRFVEAVAAIERFRAIRLLVDVKLWTLWRRGRRSLAVKHR